LAKGSERSVSNAKIGTKYSNGLIPPREYKFKINKLFAFLGSRLKIVGRPSGNSVKLNAFLNEFYTNNIYTSGKFDLEGSAVADDIGNEQNLHKRMRNK
jgi:hypothetical protein